jgi:hypothetical protein
MQIRFGETSLDFSYRRESEQMIALVARLTKTRLTFFFLFARLFGQTVESSEGNRFRCVDSCEARIVIFAYISRARRRKKFTALSERKMCDMETKNGTT